MNDVFQHKVPDNDQTNKASSKSQKWGQQFVRNGDGCPWQIETVGMMVKKLSRLVLIGGLSELAYTERWHECVGETAARGLDGKCA